MDCACRRCPDNLIYVYFPFLDAELPDLAAARPGPVGGGDERNERAVLIHAMDSTARR